MKKAFLIMAVFAAAMVLPATGQASHGFFEMDCTGTVAAGGTAECLGETLMDGRGFVSNIESHGNFHELLADGSVKVEWIDGAGRLVYDSVCTLVGVSLDGIGPFDLQNATCSNTYYRQSYRGGQQAMRVTATSNSCGDATECRFHGQLQISPSNALF